MTRLRRSHQPRSSRPRAIARSKARAFITPERHAHTKTLLSAEYERARSAHQHNLYVLQERPSSGGWYVDAGEMVWRAYPVQVGPSLTSAERAHHIGLENKRRRTFTRLQHWSSRNPQTRPYEPDPFKDYYKRRQERPRSLIG
jgi:hypothetical protein